MIQIDKYSKKYKIALERRKSPQFVSMLDSELKSSEWVAQLAACQLSLDNITKAADFETKENAIKSLFNQLYEKITAPGLDAFIGWIGSLTTSKNGENIKSFKKFLKDNYDSYADDIEKILSAKEVVSKIDEKSIFGKLISNFENKIKKIVTEFIDNNTFENEIDGLLKQLKNEYEGVSSISELNYTSVKDLYTAEQKQDNTIDFYSDIFEQARKKFQSMDVQKGEDKNTNYFTIIRNRVTSLTKSISYLVNSGVAKNNDMNIKALFLKFQKEMPIVEDDYLQSLKEFITKDWESILIKYETIKTFYSSPILNIPSSNYDGLKSGSNISNLILNYTKLYNEGSIRIVPSISASDMKNQLAKKAKSIKDMNDEAAKIMQSVNEEFTDFIEKYENQKEMLEKSTDNDASLKDNYDSIYGQDGSLDNLRNGIAECLSDGSNFFNTLANQSIFQMIELMKTTTEKFEETLKLTGLQAPMEWLDSLPDLMNLTESDIDEKKIKLLLSKGLIKLEIKKTYN